MEIITATPGPDMLHDIPVHRVRGLRMPWFELTMSTRQFREMRAALRAGAFDVVHVQSGIIAPFAYGSAAIAAKAGYPTAVTFHSVYDYLAPALRALGSLSGAKRLPIAWSAVSTFVARETSSALGGADVQVLANGVDAVAWKVPPHVREPGTLRLVSVTRLQVRKRPRDLFVILGEAQKAVGNSVRITLDIVGDGRERFFIDRLAAAAGADRVRVHGRLSRDEIRAIFARADVFVLPTRMESFGIAALEAMCAGIPVVARRNTGVEDFIVDGENGLLGDDLDGLTAAVVELACNEPLRTRIAEQNHAAHPPFAWSDIVEAALAQYARAAALQSAAAR